MSRMVVKVGVQASLVAHVFMHHGGHSTVVEMAHQSHACTNQLAHGTRLQSIIYAYLQNIVKTKHCFPLQQVVVCYHHVACIVVDTAYDLLFQSPLANSTWQVDCHVFSSMSLLWCARLEHLTN